METYDTKSRRSGCGQHRVSIHADVYKNNPKAELVAVCDIIKEKADAAAKKFGGKAFYSVQEMLDAGIQLDACSVATKGEENGSDHYAPTMRVVECRHPGAGREANQQCDWKRPKRWWRRPGKKGGVCHQPEPPLYPGVAAGQRVDRTRAAGPSAQRSTCACGSTTRSRPRPGFTCGRCIRTRLM